MQAYSVTTLNINKICSELKLAALKDFLYDSGTDIAFLQEVVTTDFSIPGFFEIFNVSAETNTGTAVFIREGIPVNQIERLESGRGIAFCVFDVTFVNIYAPSGNTNRQARAKFYKEEIVYFLRRNPANLILGGDFNCVLSRKDQFPNFNGSPELRNLVAGLQLKDAWEMKHSEYIEYTYVSSNSSSRLDRIYVSQQLAQSIIKADVIPAYFSDHSGMLACINLTAQPTRMFKNQWHLNASILHEQELQDEITEVWATCLRSSDRHPTVLDWWTKTAKPKLRRVLIRYSAERSRNLRQTIEFYYKVLRDLYEQANASPTRIQDIKKVKAKLLTLKKQQLEGLKIRSKAKSASEDETTSLYHLVHNAKNRRRTFISEIQGANGTMITRQRDIMDEVIKYYSALYAPSQSSAESVDDFISILEPKVSVADNEEVLADVSVEEARKAVWSSPRRKSPGPDGLPVEFYVKFWFLLGAIFTRMINEVFSGSTIPDDFKESKIVLIPKSRDKKSINNFRPITLLNSDYKIICRVLKTRLSPLTKKIISNHQSCAVNRTIFQTIAEYRDVIAITAVTNIKCALTFVDFNKAFDRVNHNFLFATMTKLGFRQDAVKVIQNIATGINAKIAVNCQMSRQIKVGRGVPQGSPLSMLLFVMSLEPFLRNVHAKLTGIALSGHKTVIRAYADDVGVVIRNHDEIAILDTIIRNYCVASGAQMNANKSKILNLRGFNRTATDWAQATDRHKTLGTFLVPCPMRMSALNWKDALQKVQGAVVENTPRLMNQVQRVVFINNCVLSKAFYIAQVFPLPRMIARKIMSVVANFLWKGEIFRVDLQTATLDTKNGGLGLVDIRNKASALYLKRTVNMIRDNPDSITTRLFECLKPQCQLPPVDIRKINSRLQHVRTFYIEASYVPSTIKNLRSISARDIIRERKQNEGRNKIEKKYLDYNWQTIWDNVHFEGLDSDAISAWYKAVNNIVCTNERLYDIGLSETNKCMQCQMVDTVLHRYTCGGQLTNWYWIRDNIALLARSSSAYISTTVLQKPQIKHYPKTKNNSINWLMGKYVSYVVNNLGSDNQTEFQIYMQQEYNKVKKYANHKKKYANMLKIVFDKMGIG